MIKNIFITLAIVAFYSLNVKSQCQITAYANGSTDTVEVCLGQAVSLTSAGGCGHYVLNNDFNDGTPGTGWSATNQSMFNNPCAPHSPDGTIYLWMGSTSTAPRNLTTIDFDVSAACMIEFEMRYAIQSQPSPCEGPDLYNEGIAIQYSTNGGISWNTIEYYAPNGTILTSIPGSTSPGTSGNTPFTVWTTRQVPIPAAAQTTSTRFRWAQTASTSAEYDHWGLDNVSIHCPPPNIDVWWDHGPVGFNAPDVYPTSNTTYTVNITNDIDTVQSSVHVIVNPIPTSDFTVVSSVCLGSPSTITYTGNASSSATYAWDFDGGTILSGSGQGPYQVFWSQSGTYYVTLSLIENNCQSPLTTVPVVVNPKPTAPSITYTAPCAGDDLQLFALDIPNSTYHWVGPNGFTSSDQNPIIYNVDQSHAGTYSVFIEDVNGCMSDLVSQNVIINNLPDVSFSATPTSGCEPLSVGFTNTSPGTVSYFWEFGDNNVNDTDPSPFHTYYNSGSFNVSLTITDANGCSNVLVYPQMVTVHPIPVADFSTNPIIGAPGFPILFTSSYNTPVGTWYWDFGDGSPMESYNVSSAQHAFTHIGTYSILHIVESQFGCKDSILKTILVIDIKIPNVFTPNDDGINDYFVIDGIEELSNTQLMIFNRWGTKIYESSDYKNNWNGDKAPDGVYYYIITFKDNLFLPANGTVTIIR